MPARTKTIAVELVPTRAAFCKVMSQLWPSRSCLNTAAFADIAGQFCLVVIEQPKSYDDTNFLLDFYHEADHCYLGAWHEDNTAPATR